MQTNVKSDQIIRELDCLIFDIWTWEKPTLLILVLVQENHFKYIRWKKQIEIHGNWPWRRPRIAPLPNPPTAEFSKSSGPVSRLSRTNSRAPVKSVKKINSSNKQETQWCKLWQEQKGEKIITQFFCGFLQFQVHTDHMYQYTSQKESESHNDFLAGRSICTLGNLSKCWIILNIQYTPLGSVDVVVPHACHNS